MSDETTSAPRAGLRDPLMTPETARARRLASQRAAYVVAGFSPEDAQAMILAELSRPAPAVAAPAHDFAAPPPTGPTASAGGRRVEDLIGEAAPVLSAVAALLRQDQGPRRGPRQ